MFGGLEFVVLAIILACVVIAKMTPGEKDEGSTLTNDMSYDDDEGGFDGFL